MFQRFIGRPRAARTALAWGLLFLLALAGTSCDAPLILDNPSAEYAMERRILPESVWSRKAVCYSGYRTGQSPSTQVYPTEAQILQDLNILLNAGFGFIRTYDCSTHGQRVIKVINDNHLDLKVLLGIWIAGPKATHDAENQAEIARGVALANQYPSIIAAVSVGNETMVDWSGLAVPPLDMRDYIVKVRGQIAQPVGTDDNFEPFTFTSDSGVAYNTLCVAKVVDFLAIHTYAYWDSFYDLWDWKQLAKPLGPTRAVAMMDAALAAAKKNITDVRAALKANGLDTPIVIGETGWGSSPADARFSGRASPVNQKMYYDRIQAWVYGAKKDADSPLACFYFEAFNEPWKGSDDNWGLWTVNRVPQFAISGTGYSIPDDATWYVPLVPKTPVATGHYWLLGDSAPASDVTKRVLWNEWKWSAWENGSTAGTATVAGGTESGVGNAVRVQPTPLSWGWGMAIAATQGVVNNSVENLSRFTYGHLRFKVKTTYTGCIEVGYRDGAGDAYLVLDPADNRFGYRNDGTWCTVNIPISVIRSTRAKNDLEYVYDPFVIADRYAKTGKAAGAAVTMPITLDAIEWTTD